MKKFCFKARLKSFEYAGRGILVMLKTQHNAWIHAVMTAVVILTGVYLGFTKAEWCWCVLSIMAVWTAEALNTTFELLVDVAAPEFHPLAEKAKDVAAGAVLISAIGAVIIFVIIIFPYFAG